MCEEKIIIPAPNILEGMMTRKTGSRGLVMAHPHPLYGGDINNPAVTTVTRTFASAGYTTLRFNFRGVGASQGDFSEGQGEIDDLLAARNYLADEGISEIILAGYSFGAWVIVNAAAAGKIEADSLILISPPAAMLPFAETLKLPNLKQVITGEIDEIAPPHPVIKLIDSWNPDTSFSIIKGCDHFFGGHLQDIASILKQLLK